MRNIKSGGLKLVPGFNQIREGTTRGVDYPFLECEKQGYRGKIDAVWRWLGHANDSSHLIKWLGCWIQVVVEVQALTVDKIRDLEIGTQTTGENQTVANNPAALPGESGWNECECIL